MFWSNFINTVRLKLRCVTEEDISLLAHWANLPEAYGDYLSPEGYSQKVLEERLASGRLWNDEKRLYIIETIGSANAIGTIQYWKSPSPGTGFVISLKVAKCDERGKGYGTEAQKYLIMQLFDHTPSDFIEMYTDINNIAQQKCLSRLGFEIVNSLTYDDYHESRVGYLYRLKREGYLKEAIYKYHEV